METIIKNATLGNKSSLIKLYNDNKNTSYALAISLLDNEYAAKNVFSGVFSKIWNEIKLKNIQTEKEFSLLCTKNIINGCKKEIQKKNSKALQPPKNQNFNIASEDRIANNWKEVLELLPYFQKFVFILRVVGGLSEEEIAKMLPSDLTSVKLSIGSEKGNIERLTNEITMSNVEKELLENANKHQIPNDVEYLVLKSISDYVKPFEALKSAKKKNILIKSLTVCIFVIILILVFLIIKSSGGNTSGSESSTDSQSNETNAVDIKEWRTSVEATDYAIIDIKDYGTITVALDEKTAPITVANFKELAESGFYDGLTFHRIISGFMMQGGASSNDSAENIKGEFASNGVYNDLSHVRGAISMARTDDYDGGSSQFFIVHQDSTYLDTEYAAFGYVVDGMNVVDAVCSAAAPTDGNGTISYADQPIINYVKILTTEEYENQSESSSAVLSDDASYESSDETMDISNVANEEISKEEDN